MLLKSPVVGAFDEPWRNILDDLARARGWASSLDPARLGLLVRKLADAYNGPSAAPVRDEDALAARLGFSFPRDAPKGAGAVRDLVGSGALAFPRGRALRVLDLGAGLGATSRGLARALAAAGLRGELAVEALDADKGALELSSALVKARPVERDVRITWNARVASLNATIPADGPYDVILLGQVLSELDRDLSADERVSRHAALLRSLVRLLTDDGSLVVIEPGLRERARHLHAVRDATLVDSGLTVFAPCVHDSPCPARVDADAWCHEDLDVDLPPWLVPVARAAGLRWQGLTFSYVVFRRDGRRQTDGFVGSNSASRLFRVVSSPVVTKGKRELFLCGRFEDEPLASRRKVMRLDRHGPPRSGADDVWALASRGDVLALAPSPLASRPRVLADTGVDRLVFGDPKPRVLRGLYAIVDQTSLASRGLDVMLFARAVLAARPAAIQLRMKGSSEGDALALLRSLEPLAREHGVPLVANDHVHAAALAGCDYVHVGQTDMDVSEVRKAAPSLAVGVSTHTLAQLSRALEARPDYVAFGPVFATLSKEQPDPCVGLDGLETAAKATRKASVPLVAIGGVTLDSARVVSQWADATAVIGALLPEVGSSDPYAEVTAQAKALHLALGGAVQP